MRWPKLRECLAAEAVNRPRAGLRRQRFANRHGEQGRSGYSRRCCSRAVARRRERGIALVSEFGALTAVDLGKRSRAAFHQKAIVSEESGGSTLADPSLRARSRRQAAGRTASTVLYIPSNSMRVPAAQLAQLVSVIYEHTPDGPDCSLFQKVCQCVGRVRRRYGSDVSVGAGSAPGRSTRTERQATGTLPRPYGADIVFVQ